MPVDSIDPVPSRGHNGWSAPTRLQAASQLRSRLEGVTTSRDLARVGAEYLRELLSARAASITTLEDGQFNELANVGTLPPPTSWYPRETVYPESVFPSTSQKLRAGGYFTADLDDHDYLELVGSRDDPEVTSVMGVPIDLGGHLRGEVFLTRGRDQGPFDAEDLDASRGLATILGESLRESAR